MIQLELEMFFPLTEQINLDLNFKPCEEYNEKQCKKQNYIGYTSVGPTA